MKQSDFADAADAAYMQGHEDGYKEGLRDAGYDPRETLFGVVVGAIFGAFVTVLLSAL